MKNGRNMANFFKFNHYGMERERNFFLLLFLFFGLKFADGAKTYPIYARIRNGTLMGEHVMFDPVGCDCFLGVPYAKAPVGALRFQVIYFNFYLYFASTNCFFIQIFMEASRASTIFWMKFLKLSNVLVDKYSFCS